MKLSDLKSSEVLSCAFESLVLGNMDARENIEKIVYMKDTDTLPVACDVGEKNNCNRRNRIFK